MWFNNRFNEDNTIHFDVNEWVCTDVDEFQYCRKVDSTTFEYIQLKNKELVRDSLCLGRQILEYLNDETTIKDWFQDEIDVTDYNDKEIAEYISPYGGEDFLGQSKGATRNQLIAECIFEQDVVFSGYFED